MRRSEKYIFYLARICSRFVLGGICTISLRRESEYWLALIKVILIVLFIIVGLIYDCGGIKNHPGPVRALPAVCARLSPRVLHRASPTSETVKHS